MKKIIVTGCSKGIGASITETLIANEYKVVGVSRTINSTIKNFNLSKNFSHFKVDLTNKNELNTFIELFNHEPIYGLINNAGIGLDGILATLPESDIDNLIALNLKVPIILCRSMSRNIIKYKNKARIINISSIISQSGYNGLSVYSATKSGLNGLTISLARELGRTGTTVNAILPGYIKTDMSSKLKEKQLNQIIRRTPLGQLVESNDVAELANFLLSPSANSITGQLIRIDGGISS